MKRCTSIQTTAASQTAEELYQEALVEKIAKNYEAALSKLDEALKLQSDYSPALTLRGKVVLALGRHENGDIKSASSSDMSVEELSGSEPDDDLSEDEILWDSNIMKGSSSESEWEKENLLKKDRILKTRPNHFPTLWRSIRSLLRLRRHDEALKRFDACLKIESGGLHGFVLLHKAELLQSLGRHNEALETCHVLLKTNPESNIFSLMSIMLALKMCDEMLMEQDRCGELLETCDLLSKMKPNNANKELIDKAFKMRCKILMRQEILGALRSNDEDEVKTNSIFTHLPNEQPVSATHVEELFNKAMSHFWKTEYTKALSQLDEVLKIQPNHRNALRLRGFTSIYLEKTEYLQIQPNDYLSHGMRARSLQYHGSYSKALESCDAMLAIKPNNPWGLAMREYIARAVVKTEPSSFVRTKTDLSSFKPTKEALLKFDQFLRRGPLSNASPPIPAKLEIKSNPNQQPISAASNVVTQELSPDQRAKALFSEGKKLYDEEKYNDALLKFDQSLEIRPNHPGTLKYRGEALYKLGRCSEALENCNNVLKIDPNVYVLTIQWGSLYQLGMVNYENKEYEEALLKFDLCVRINPDSWYGHNWRILSLRNLKRYSEALESCDVWQRIDPGHDGPRLYKEQILRALGRNDEAELVKIQIPSPNQQPIVPARAVLTADLSYISSVKLAEELIKESTLHYGKGEYEAAVSKANQFLKIRPHHPAGLRSRSEALMALGRYEQAVESCDICLLFDSNDIEALRIRAQSLVGLGCEGEALESCDAYLKIVPKDVWILSIRAKLLSSSPATTDLSSNKLVEELFAEGKKLYDVCKYGVDVDDEDELLKDALLKFDESLKVRPNHPGTLRYRAQTLLALYRSDEAQEDCEALLKIEPNNAFALQMRADCLAESLSDIGKIYSNKNAKEALLKLDESLKILPEHPGTLECRAGALDKLGRYSEALENCDALLKVDPNANVIDIQWNSLHKLGMLNYGNKEYEEALLKFELCVKILPGWKYGHLRRTWLLWVLKRYNEALESSDAWLRVEPENVDARSYREQILRALGRNDEAELAKIQIPSPNQQPIVPARAVLTADLSYISAVKLAGELIKESTFHYGKGEYEEAVSKANQFLKIRPHHPAGLRSRSAALLALGRYNDALESCDICLILDSNDIEALRIRAQLLVGLGCEGEALESCDAYLKIVPNDARFLSIRAKLLPSSPNTTDLSSNKLADELFAEGKELYNKDKREDALLKFDESLKICPNHPGALRYRAQTLPAVYRSDEALKDWETLLKIEPNNVFALQGQAEALSSVGEIYVDEDARYEEALLKFNESLRIRPNHLRTLRYRGEALYELGRYKEALEDCDNALKIDPNDADTLRIRAKICAVGEELLAEGKNLYNRNKHEDALLKFDQFLKVQPNHSEALRMRAEICGEFEEQLFRAVGTHYWKDEYEEAVSMADRSLKNRPNHPLTLRYRGKALFALARYSEALENCNALLKIDPNDADALRVKEAALSALGSKDDFAAALSNLSSDKIAEEPFNEVAWHYQKGEYEEAISKANQLLKIQRKDPATLRLRGEALFALGRYEQALESCNTCLEVNPNDTVALRVKAQSLLGLGRNEEALVACDAYLTILPNNARGLTIRRMAEVLPPAKPVVLNPPSLNVVLDDANVHYERGIKLSEAGTYKEAISEFSRAIELNPSEPLYYKQRARCLEAIGDFKAALLDYKEVIDFENQGIVVERAEEQTALKKEDRLLETRLQLTQKNLRDNKLEVHELEVQRKQIQQLQQDQAIIQSLLNASKSERLAEREFKKHPNLWTHYRQVKLKLEEVFSGCKPAASGLIPHQQKGTIGNVGTGINLVGKAFSLIPVIGNTIGGILSAGSNAVNEVDYRRQQNILIDISALGSVMELINISENVARELTNRYRDQLLLLCGSEEEAYSVQQRNAVERLGKVKSGASRMADTALEKTLVVHKKDQAQKVAEYAVLKMLEGLQDGHIAQNINSTIEDQLIKAVMGVGSVSRIERMSQKLGLDSMMNLNGVEWKLRDIYQAPVVKTKDDKFYGHSGSDAEHYGYRMAASAQEAESWGLTPIPKPSSTQDFSLASYQLNINRTSTTNNNTSSTMESFEEKTVFYHYNKQEDSGNGLKEIQEQLSKLETELASTDKNTNQQHENINRLENTLETLKQHGLNSASQSDVKGIHDQLIRLKSEMELRDKSKILNDKIEELKKELKTVQQNSSQGVSREELAETKGQLNKLKDELALFLPSGNQVQQLSRTNEAHSKGALMDQKRMAALEAQVSVVTKQMLKMRALGELNQSQIEENSDRAFQEIQRSHERVYGKLSEVIEKVTERLEHKFSNTIQASGQRLAVLEENLESTRNELAVVNQKADRTAKVADQTLSLLLRVEKERSKEQIQNNINQIIRAKEKKTKTSNCIIS